MGKILVNIKITNRVDEAAAKRGLISSNKVRFVELKNVLVDTGADTLCLPISMINYLGLDFVEDRNLKTANGIVKAGLYADAKVALGSRQSTPYTIALPDGIPPLLGCIPLEQMGVVLNLQKQCVEFLPIEGENTYMTVY